MKDDQKMPLMEIHTRLPPLPANERSVPEYPHAGSEKGITSSDRRSSRASRWSCSLVYSGCVECTDTLTLTSSLGTQNSFCKRTFSLRPALCGCVSPKFTPRTSPTLPLEQPQYGSPKSVMLERCSALRSNCFPTYCQPSSQQSLPKCWPSNLRQRS